MIRYTMCFNLFMCSALVFVFYSAVYRHMLCYVRIVTSLALYMLDFVMNPHIYTILSIYRGATGVVSGMQMTIDMCIS
jgi:hypothetical protein